MPRAIAASSSAVLRINLGCFFIAVYLPVVGFAQTDNPKSFAALREHHAIEAVVDYGIANFAQLALILTVVGCAPYGRPIDSVSERQRNAVFALVGFALCLVIGRFH
jgi:hypothetical protein